MALETKILESLMDQSLLAGALALVFFSYRRLVHKIIRIVENNTEAMTKTSEVLKKCKDK